MKVGWRTTGRTSFASSLQQNAFGFKPGYEKCLEEVVEEASVFLGQVPGLREKACLVDNDWLGENIPAAEVSESDLRDICELDWGTTHTFSMPSSLNRFASSPGDRPKSMEWLLKCAGYFSLGGLRETPCTRVQMSGRLAMVRSM